MVDTGGVTRSSHSPVGDPVMLAWEMGTSCDSIWMERLGSRLEPRNRSGDPAIDATFGVVDVMDGHTAGNTPMVRIDGVENGVIGEAVMSNVVGEGRGERGKATTQTWTPEFHVDGVRVTRVDGSEVGKEKSVGGDMDSG